VEEGMGTSLQVVVEMVENFSDYVLSPQGTQPTSSVDFLPGEIFSPGEIYQHLASSPPLEA
jgi:hypothetical protein